MACRGSAIRITTTPDGNRGLPILPPLPSGDPERPLTWARLKPVCRARFCPRLRTAPSACETMMTARRDLAAAPVIRPLSCISTSGHGFKHDPRQLRPSWFFRLSPAWFAERPSRAGNARATVAFVSRFSPLGSFACRGKIISSVFQNTYVPAGIRREPARRTLELAMTLTLIHSSPISASFDLRH